MDPHHSEMNSAPVKEKHATSRKYHHNLAPIPIESSSNNHWWSSTITDTPLVSPKTYAVSLLEEISQDIMSRYPDVIRTNHSNFETPEEEMNELCFQIVLSTARHFISMKVKDIIAAIWQKVNVLIDLIKDSMTEDYVGNPVDSRLEPLASTCMINVFDNIKEDVSLLPAQHLSDSDITESDDLNPSFALADDVSDTSSIVLYRPPFKFILPLICLGIILFTKK